MRRLISVSNNHPTVNILKSLRFKDGTNLCYQFNTLVLWHWHYDTGLCQARYMPGLIQYSFTCENPCTIIFSICLKVTFNKNISVLPFESLGSWKPLFHAQIRLAMSEPGLTSDHCFLLWCLIYLLKLSLKRTKLYWSPKILGENILFIYLREINILFNNKRLFKAY